MESVIPTVHILMMLELSACHVSIWYKICYADTLVLLLFVIKTILGSECQAPHHEAS